MNWQLFWGWVGTIGLFFIFMGFYLNNRSRLFNGILFNIFLVPFLIMSAWSIFATNSKILIAVFGIPFVIIVLTLSLLFAFQSILLIWNGFVVWRRESHSLANSLTLLLGVSLVVVPIIMHILTHNLPEFWNTFF